MKDCKRIKKLTEYIAFPLAFFLFGYLFFYLALNPYFGLVLSGWELFSSDANLLQGEEIHKDIFGEGKLEGYEGSVPASLITYPRSGTKYAELTLKTNGQDYVVPLYFGDSPSILRRGAGHYMGSHFPGNSSTVLVSGHNNSYFSCLQYVKAGEVIELETNYGTYVYEVTETAIKSNTDPSAYDLNAPEENLVLYTCYPFTQLGLTRDRFFVYTRLVSGPVVLADE